MSKKVSKIIRRIIIAVSIIFVGGWPSVAMALDRDPNAPNCFVNTAQGYYKNPCPDNARIQNGKCYSLQQRGQSYLVHELRCTDGSTIGAPFTVDGLATPIPPPTISSATTGSAELDGWLQAVINLLSAAVGLIIVISLIIAGIQYTASGSNASQVAAAKGRISMSILALVLYIFGYGILQWLVPGGIF